MTLFDHFVHRFNVASQPKDKEENVEEHLPLHHGLSIEMSINIKFLYFIVNDDYTK